MIVDDDAAIREVIRSCLEPEGFLVSEAGNEDELIAILDGQPADLITLDLKLGNEDGLAVARAVRKRADVPIIMVTGKAEAVDRVVGLELGADDYITKPFHVRELLARVRSVLRRNNRSPREGDEPAAEKYMFGGWILDCSRRELASPAAKTTRLTSTEFKLLEAFALRPNRVLSRNQIMDLVKGPEWAANDRAVDNQIGRLRRKMAEMDDAEEMIQSVRGAGYMLAANVTKVSASDLG